MMRFCNNNDLKNVLFRFTLKDVDILQEEDPSKKRTPYRRNYRTYFEAKYLC